ncbi:MAG: formimidoylglutamate deiminase [Hyphomicrobiaceae bacterium]|nr:MAG: formimidoylglutamate deiminase [Hyphomicrobiaceae bacterium]
MALLHVSSALLETGWHRNVLFTVEGRMIVDIAPDVAPPPAAERLQGIAVPGVANVHSHAFQRAMAGLAERRGPEDDSFWTWREIMYRFLAVMTPNDVEAVAAWLYVEMLEAGFTSVGEFHYLHNAPDGARYADPAEMGSRIVAAAEAAGIGLTLLPCFYAHGGCGGLPPVPGQARFLSDLDGFARLVDASRRHVARLDGANLGIAPHSLRAVDARELRALVAAHPVGPIHIHAAEQTREVDECTAWSGARPVEWLLDNMGVDARWCLIHCTHMTDKESRRLAQSGAVAGLCPITEANLGDGIFEAPRYLGAGGRFAIGSDSNVRISLGEELRTLEYGQRLRERKRNRLGPPGSSTGRHLFDAARRGGAQALGLSSGALAAGNAADIVILDDTSPALVARTGDAVLDSWTFAAGDGIARDVYAGGRRVVAGGRHVRRDEIRARFTRTLARLPGNA